MHKTEHSTPFLKKIGHIAALIALVAATLVAPASIASASEFPNGYPKMGKSSESITGYNVGSGRSSYRTALFPVYTHPGSAADHFAYCVELSVGTRYEINLNVGGWDTFPGDNNFRHDQLAREKAAWIANNSFPKRELREVAENAGIDVSRLTEKEAITATQAAIWSYTDGYPARTGFKYTKLAYENGKPVSSDKQERINKLFDYLTGSANTGRPEVLAPTLNVNSPAEAGKAGTRVGPIVIDASEDFVTVTTDTDYIVVDADGNQVDLNKVPGKSALYVEVPQDALTGTATFNVALTGSRYTGQLLTNVKSRTQSLIISQSDTVNLSAAARVDWKRGPSIATTARSGDAGKAEGGNAKFLVAGNEATVVDLVEYTGLTPGVEHELQGELMIRDGDNAVATGITASTTFTPTEQSGTVELTFAVDAAELNGKIIVAFERVLVNGEEVAAHTDIFDESQTVYRPAIETDAFDLVDSDQVLDVNGGTLRDRISYEGLRVGSNYVARGVIMDQATGESTGVIAETVFTATTPDGYVDVDFEVPAGHAGRVLVVFEELYLLEGDEPVEETLVASHKDIMDGRQTVTVAEEPVIEEPEPEEPAEPEEPGKEVPPVEEPPAEEPPVEEEPNSDEEPADEETPVVEVLDDVIENDDEDEDVTVTEESDEDDDLAATGFGIGAPVILTGSLLILAGAGLVIARRRTA
ncbi:VaFE repeat-containing surface-anchored protein [Populibacterium corticicola]|uniref:VaFE repeat-containing surface-anchored protein n=1 Tax=Populibacterium corticicola TaxID=1812826 RepID=A0ABW5XCE9_9MICO